MVEWIKPGNTAVITGGASGIGLAAASRYLAADMRVMIADIKEDALDSARQALAESHENTGTNLFSQVCDVSSNDAVRQLKQVATDKLGTINCLMNNAGAGVRTASPWDDIDKWKKQIDINLWGIIHGCHAFMPDMLASKERCAVINTGSKQGITNPPGNYAYNMSKAGVKAYTESVAHALRQEEDCRVSAHLMVPGFTYTGMIARFVPEKPAGAWTPEQAVDFMLASLDRGDFYILCPDNETPRELDEKRIQWNTDDLVKNRSALSRWDAAYQAEYEKYVARQPH